MRKYVFFALVVLVTLNQVVFSENSPSSQNIELQGSWSYSIDYSNESVTIKGKSISNISKANTSGSILYCLMLTDSEYKGGQITGWPIYKSMLNPLAVGKQYLNIDSTLKIENQPKTGKYYVTLILLEERYKQYGVVSYVLYDQLNYKNTKEDAINAKLAELNEAQNSYNYYYNGIQSTDPNVILNNSIQALNMTNKIQLIKTDLLNLGYYVNDPQHSTYISSTWSYKIYSDVIDNNTPSTSTYSVAPAYSPANNVQNTYSSGTASNSNSNSDSLKNGLLLKYKQDLDDARMKLVSDQRQYDIDKLKDADSSTIDWDIKHIEQDRNSITHLEDLIFKISN